MNRREEIEARLAAIRVEIEQENADLDALTEEVRGLKAELKSMDDAAEKRRKLMTEVSAGAGVTVRTFGRADAEEKPFALDSEEYRAAWLKHMQGRELNAAEQRAFTASNGAISTLVVNDIMSVVRDHAPLMDRITMVYSGSKITYYVEGTTSAAAEHTENGTITAASDTLTSVSLTPAEIVKLIQVSDSARNMSVPVFNSWLARTLGEAIARKINADIVTTISATGNSAGTTITAANVQALLGMVKGERVALLVNRKTLFTGLLPLQDNSKSSIVRFDGGNTAYVYGVEVLVDDNIADSTVLAGDMSKVIGAMAEDITVREGFDIDTNSYKYLGVALFDVAVGVSGAFAKIATA